MLSMLGILPSLAPQKPGARVMEGHLTEPLTVQVRKPGSRLAGHVRSGSAHSGRERQPGELGSACTPPPV